MRPCPVPIPKTFTLAPRGKPEVYREQAWAEVECTVVRARPDRLGIGLVVMGRWVNPTEAQGKPSIERAWPWFVGVIPFVRGFGDRIVLGDHLLGTWRSEQTRGEAKRHFDRFLGFAGDQPGMGRPWAIIRWGYCV